MKLFEAHVTYETESKLRTQFYFEATATSLIDAKFEFSAKITQNGEDKDFKIRLNWLQIEKERFSEDKDCFLIKWRNSKGIAEILLLRTYRRYSIALLLTYITSHN